MRRDVDFVIPRGPTRHGRVMTSRLSCLVSLPALLLACSADDVTIPRGGSTDAGLDARHAVDAPHDSTSPSDASRPDVRVAHDALTDVTGPNDAHDAQTDADAGARDAGHDATADASDGGEPAFVAIATGSGFNCALGADGSVWCWGQNDKGELGSTPAASELSCGVSHCDPKPQRVPVIDDATEIALGIEFGCAIRADRSVWCWGQNDSGQLGHAPGTSGDQSCANAVDGGMTSTFCNPTPQPVPLPEGVRAAHVSNGWAIACVDTQAVALGGGAFEGDVYCWGMNDHDAIGLANDAGYVIPTPNKITGFASDVVDVAVSGDTRHVCAVRHDGSVWCWGDDFQGRIGALEGTGQNGYYYHYTPNEVRVEAPSDAGPDAGDIGRGAPLANAMAVSLGDGTSCALKFDGTLWCWGNDAIAGLADDGPYLTVQHPGARQVPGLPSNIAHFYRHALASVAVDGDGNAYAWGENSFYQVPITSGVLCQNETDGPFRCVVPAVEVSSLAGARALALNEYNGLMLTSAGGLWAWGGNEYAQLGHLPATQGDTTCSAGGVTTACNVTPTPVTFP